MAYFQVTCLFCVCIWANAVVFGNSISGPADASHLRPVKEKEAHPNGFSDMTMDGESLDKDRTDIPSASRLTHSVQPYVDASPYLGIFSQDFQGLDGKRRGGSALRTTRIKRTPTGFTARGFHEGVFDRDFGHFSPVKRTQKRKPEADAAGFYGDTFSNGFGEFETMKRDLSPYVTLNEKEISQLFKRRPEMGATGFHGDTFAQGFGEFDTMKRQYPYNNWIEAVKRKPEMTKSGFHGDVFNGGFGEFHPMRK